MTRKVAGKHRKKHTEQNDRSAERDRTRAPDMLKLKFDRRAVSHGVEPQCCIYLLIALGLGIQSARWHNTRRQGSGWPTLVSCCHCQSTRRDTRPPRTKGWTGVLGFQLAQRVLSRYHQKSRGWDCILWETVYHFWAGCKATAQCGSCSFVALLTSRSNELGGSLDILIRKCASAQDSFRGYGAASTVFTAKHNLTTTLKIRMFQPGRSQSVIERSRPLGVVTYLPSRDRRLRVEPSQR